MWTRLQSLTALQRVKIGAPIAASIALVGVLSADHPKSNPIKHEIHSYTQLFDAWLFDATHGERKRELFKSIRGRCLELGPGSGNNFQFFPKDVEWTGIDHNPATRTRLERNAAVQGFPPNTLQLQQADVTQQLAQCPAGSIDTILATQLLGSVQDTDATLASIHRALKPGGRFYFVETSTSAWWSPMRLVQSLFNPLHYLWDGSVTRNVAQSILNSEFQKVHLECWPNVPPSTDASNATTTSRAGVKMVEFAAEAREITGGLPLGGVTGCVVAGVCVKEKLRGFNAKTFNAFNTRSSGLGVTGQ